MARNVPLGLNQKIARNENNAFIGTAACRRRQFRFGCFCNVYADDGEIAGGELEDVGTVVKSDCLPPVCMGIRANSTKKFNRRFHILRQSEKSGEIARIKYQL